MSLTVMSDGSEKINYRDPAIPLYMVRGDLTVFPYLAALCHWHEEIEILMALEGHLSYNVDGRVVEIGEGDAIIVNSRQMHFGFSADGTNCVYFCLDFPPQLISPSEAVQKRYLDPILTDANLPYLLLRRDDPRHQPILAVLAELDRLRDYVQGQELLVIGKLFTLWQGLYSLLEPRELTVADGGSLIQKQMLEFIRTHYRERLSLDQIAASGGVCRSRCCQLFKKYMGRSPNDYLTFFRLERAMALLRETRLSVTEITYECGFGSGSYFTELFNRYKGCSPTQYRKKTG